MQPRTQWIWILSICVAAATAGCDTESLRGFSGAFAGTVQDAASGLPIKSALVELDGHEQSSDDMGQVLFEDLAPDDYSVSVEATGWESATFDIDVDLGLNEQTLELSGMTCKGLGRVCETMVFETSSQDRCDQVEPLCQAACPGALAAARSCLDISEDCIGNIGFESVCASAWDRCYLDCQACSPCTPECANCWEATQACAGRLAKSACATEQECTDHLNKLCGPLK